MTAVPVRIDPRPSARPALAVVAVLLLLSMGVQAVRDRGWAPYEPIAPVMWLRSGPLLERLSLGFDALVADLYWIRAVVYYGGKRLTTGRQRNFEQLYPLLDLVTTVDPHFRVAYRFGAIFLTEAYPNGPGRPDQAVSLLTRGILRDNGRWEYFEDIGFIYYWWLRDYTAAAGWFAKAAEQPGAPDWLKPLAATTLAQGGDRTSSRFLWRQILETADVDWLKTNAQLRLAQLDAMDQIDELNRLSWQFIESQGRPPRDWRELAVSARLRGVPLDPAGTLYVLDPATGAIDLSRQSPLWPLPVGGPAQQLAPQ